MQVTSKGPSFGLHIYSTSKDSFLIALLLIDWYAYFARVYIALKMGEGSVCFFSLLHLHVNGCFQKRNRHGW